MTREDAEKLAAEARARGASAEVYEQKSGGTEYNVRILDGPAPTAGRDIAQPHGEPHSPQAPYPTDERKV